MSTKPDSQDRRYAAARLLADVIHLATARRGLLVALVTAVVVPLTRKTRPGAAPVLPAAPTPAMKDLEWCANNATWPHLTYQPGGVGIYHQYHLVIRRMAARHYASTYLARHGRLPEGEHDVSVTFGPPGIGDLQGPAAFGDPAKQSVRQLRVAITYPSARDRP